MPLDAMFLSCLVRELDADLTGARIDKIHMPERDEVFVLGRNHKGPFRLLLSANPSFQRLQLTGRMGENPLTPPMFCMLLRKHLISGRITGVRALPAERVAVLAVESYGELGDLEEKQLILELLGRQSNLILTDGRGKVLGALHQSDLSQTRGRMVMPGLPYEPPAAEKRNPFTDLPAILEELRACRTEEAVDGWLLSTVMGFSPLLCRELTYRVCGSIGGRMDELTETQRGELEQELCSMVEQARSGVAQPCLLINEEGGPADFSYLPVQQYGSRFGTEQPADCSALLESFYSLRDRTLRLKQKSATLHKLVKNNVEKLTRKINAQRAELSDTAERDKYRVWGELLTAHLSQVPKGAAKVTLPDYYQENRPTDIPLDPAKSPAQNAQFYFKKYQKAKTAANILKEQIEKAESELTYLLSVQAAIETAEGEGDLNEIREELTQGKYLAAKKQTGGKRKPDSAAPRTFRSDDGFTVLVGRNNLQNDQLALRQARKGDLWLHAQNIPGSHVLIVSDGKPIPDNTVTQAAILAACYSAAGTAGNASGDKIPVIYTEARHLTKPPGARPGFVIFHTNRTAFVAPDPQLAKRLRVR